MFKIKVNIKESNPRLWKQSGSVPNAALVNVAKFAAALVAERVLKQTRTAHGGQFPAYKKAKQGKRKRYFWVTPNFKQPTTGRVGYQSLSSNVETRKSDSGAVAYEDRGAYEEALGAGRSRKKKRFSMSGEMWKGLTVEPRSPAHVAVLFKKGSLGYTTTPKNPRAKRITNAKKATYSARSANRHILELSDAEVRKVVEYAFAIITESSFKGFLDQEKLFQIAKLQNKIRRKIKNIDNFRKTLGSR